MAKLSCSHKTLTPTATADATNLVDSTYPFAIQGGGATQRITIYEIYLGGQAGASSPTFMGLGRDSQVGTGALTKDTNLLTNAALDGSNSVTTTLPAVFNLAATNKPQRSTTLGGLLNLTFNAFGGIVRWVAAPGEEISTVGASASLGEVSLSAFTGGTAGLLGAHCIYEAA